jgi:hypothetical protein
VDAVEDVLGDNLKRKNMKISAQHPCWITRRGKGGFVFLHRFVPVW